MQGSLGVKLGEGAYSEAYAWAPGEVVKLFKPGLPRRMPSFGMHMIRVSDAVGVPVLRYIQRAIPQASKVLGGRSEKISQVCVVWGKAVAVCRYHLSPVQPEDVGNRLYLRHG
jgi:hypothetical protein